ncbi:MAG: primosomal protein N', partial [Oscillospiraceae bacterium]|nr:primosomal protein N' [Oscillospiraceae bacterium]
MALLANVVVEKTTYAFDSPFSYSVPPALEQEIRPGCRVMVPFGSGNRKRQGLVLELKEEQLDMALKEVASLVDREPILNQEQLQLLHLLHDRVFCTYYDAMKVLIPSGLGLKVN